MSARDRRILACLERHGIVYPRTTLRLARRVNREQGHMPLALACALLDQETGGGHSVFGHDPTIFSGAGKVTKRKYRAYLRQRGPEGRGGMQGVSSLQLTYWSIQDEADRRGGCWRPNINIYVGLSHLAAQIEAHGHHGGIRAYNGAGAAAEAYAREVANRQKRWKRIIDKEA